MKEYHLLRGNATSGRAGTVGFSSRRMMWDVRFVKTCTPGKSIIADWEKTSGKSLGGGARPGEACNRCERIGESSATPIRYFWPGGWFAPRQWRICGVVHSLTFACMVIIRIRAFMTLCEKTTMRSPSNMAFACTTPTAVVVFTSRLFVPACFSMWHEPTKLRSGKGRSLPRRLRHRQPRNRETRNRVYCSMWGL